MVIGKKKAPEAKELDLVAGQIKAGGDYGNWGMSFYMSRHIPVGTDPDEALDEISNTLTTRMDSYVEDNGLVRAGDSGDVQPDTFDTPEEVDPDEEVDEPGDEADLTEDDIKKMKRPELVQLIEDEELETDPADYKKIADLRDAVIEEAFGEEEEAKEDDAEEESDEEEGDDGWGDFDDDKSDDAEESDDPEEEADDSLTEEDIMAMKRPELVALIKDEELDTDPKKYKVLSKLRAAVIEEAFGE
jgi:hypothetical protein